jgi:hypothetical protein
MSFIEVVPIKSTSASYFNGNLAVSSNFLAIAKNGFQSGRICIYSKHSFEENSRPEMIEDVEWEAKTKECSHLNYVFVHEKWYLVIGFTGSLEIYS